MLDLTLTYEGRNLTAAQSERNPVIFSPDFDNIEAQEYIDSEIGYKNFAYVGGQGEGEMRTIEQVGTSTGLDRREMFIDARDLDDQSTLIDRGVQKLQELDMIESLEANILTYGPFIYEKDWDLGDIVTIQNKKWNVTLDARVTEIREVYESSLPGNFKLEVTFGNSSPTLIDKVKQELSQISGEIRR